MCVLYVSWILSLDVDSQSRRTDCLKTLSWLRFLQALFMKTPIPPRMFITQLAVVILQYISQNIKYWHWFVLSQLHFYLPSLCFVSQNSTNGTSGEPCLLFDFFYNPVFLFFQTKPSSSLKTGSLKLTVYWRSSLSQPSLNSIPIHRRLSVTYNS